MAETCCHIHFPDSNRSNPNEKSNQVSIAGKNKYTGVSVSVVVPVAETPPFFVIISILSVQYRYQDPSKTYIVEASISVPKY